MRTRTKAALIIALAFICTYHECSAQSDEETDQSDSLEIVQFSQALLARKIKTEDVNKAVESVRLSQLYLSRIEEIGNIEAAFADLKLAYGFITKKERDEQCHHALTAYMNAATEHIEFKTELFKYVVNKKK